MVNSKSGLNFSNSFMHTSLQYGLVASPIKYLFLSPLRLGVD